MAKASVITLTCFVFLMLILSGWELRAEKGGVEVNVNGIGKERNGIECSNTGECIIRSICGPYGQGCPVCFEGHCECRCRT
ncbi:hypothetical protein K1719_037520 [Acacia pycnantha]|nr:hypothetical protein K1719_037520 [Acacia pycnantha]